MVYGICELLWLKSEILIKRTSFFDQKWPMKLYCDNKAPINIAHNPIQHNKTKHAEVDWHVIKAKSIIGRFVLLL